MCKGALCSCKHAHVNKKGHIIHVCVHSLSTVTVCMHTFTRTHVSTYVRACVCMYVCMLPFTECKGREASGTMSILSLPSWRVLSHRRGHWRPIEPVCKMVAGGGNRWEGKNEVDIRSAAAIAPISPTRSPQQLLTIWGVESHPFSLPSGSCIGSRAALTQLAHNGHLNCDSRSFTHLAIKTTDSRETSQSCSCPPCRPGSECVMTSVHMEARKPDTGL